MGFLKDWGTALSRGFQRTRSALTTLVKNPKKLNIGDAAAIAFPFVGGTIVEDIKHPKDIGYQALTLGLAAGGAGLIAPSSAAPAQAAVFNDAGFAVGGLTPRTVPTLALSPEPGVFTSIAASMRAPTAVELAAQQGLAAPAAVQGVGDVLAEAAGSAGKSTASFVTKAAELSAAARQIATPWERAANTVREALGVGPAPAAAGPSTYVNAGGGAPGAVEGRGAAEPIQAGASNWLMIGFFVSVAGSLLWTALRPKGKKR